MDTFEKDFSNKAVIRGGIYLYNFKDAIDLIERCRQFNKRILGIDAFIISETTTQPVSEHSAEFKGQNNWQHAKEFIQKKKNEGLYFEVVYE